MSVHVSIVDESSEERKPNGTLRRNRSCGEVLDGGGGLPTLVEEEAQKLLWEVYPLLLDTCMTFSLFFLYFVLHSCSKSNLHDKFLLFRVWIYWKEPVHWGKRLSDWRLRGWEKLEQQWQDWRWKAYMDSWGEPYHIPYILHPTHPHLKEPTTLHLPPSLDHLLRRLKKLYPKLPLLWQKMSNRHWKPPPLLHLQL